MIDRFVTEELVIRDIVRSFHQNHGNTLHYPDNPTIYANNIMTMEIIRICDEDEVEIALEQGFLKYDWNLLAYVVRAGTLAQCNVLVKHGEKFISRTNSLCLSPEIDDDIYCISPFWDQDRVGEKEEKMLLLMGKKDEIDFDPSLALFGALLVNDTTVVEYLENEGIALSPECTKHLRDRKGLYWNILVDILSEKKHRVPQAIKYLHERIGDFNMPKCMFTEDALHDRKILELLLKSPVKPQIELNKLFEAVKNDRKMIQAMMESGWFDQPDSISSFISFLLSHSMAKEAAWTMEYMQKHKDTAALHVNEQVEMEESLLVDLYSKAEIGKKWEYEIHDGKVILCSYLGEETDVYVPDHIGDAKVVTIISSFSYYRCANVERAQCIDNIECVHIPEGIKTFIGCFKYNKKLKHVTLPSTLEHIIALDPDDFIIGCRKIKELTIPPKVKDFPAKTLYFTELEQLTFLGETTIIPVDENKLSRYASLHKPSIIARPGSPAWEYAKEIGIEPIPL